MPAVCLHHLVPYAANMLALFLTVALLQQAGPDVSPRGNFTLLAIVNTGEWYHSRNTSSPEPKPQHAQACCCAWNASLALQRLSAAAHWRMGQPLTLSLPGRLPSGRCSSSLINRTFVKRMAVLFVLAGALWQFVGTRASSPSPFLTARLVDRGLDAPLLSSVLQQQPERGSFLQAGGARPAGFWSGSVSGTWRNLGVVQRYQLCSTCSASAGAILAAATNALNPSWARVEPANRHCQEAGNLPGGACNLNTFCVWGQLPGYVR